MPPPPAAQPPAALPAAAQPPGQPRGPRARRPHLGSRTQAAAAARAQSGPQASAPLPDRRRRPPRSARARLHARPWGPWHPAAPADPRGSVTVDVLRQAWPSVVEAIKAKGRVAAIVIGNASVASFDEGVLTLRFPRQGDVKGFQGSKYEDLLKQAIATMFGVNVVIRAVTGGGDAPSAGRRPGQPRAVRPGSAQRRAAVVFRPVVAGPAGTGPAGTRAAPGRTEARLPAFRRGRAGSGTPGAASSPGSRTGRGPATPMARPARPGTQRGWDGRRHAPVRRPGQRRRRPAAVAAAPAIG